MINEIVIRGPINNKIQDEYRHNSNGSHFSKVHFQKVMLNGEIYKRRWLVDSQSTDKIYCLCCKLFCQIHNSNLSKKDLMIGNIYRSALKATKYPLIIYAL